MLHYRSVRRKW